MRSRSLIRVRYQIGNTGFTNWIMDCPLTSATIRSTHVDSTDSSTTRQRLPCRVTAHEKRMHEFLEPHFLLLRAPPHNSICKCMSHIDIGRTFRLVLIGVHCIDWRSAQAYGLLTMNSKSESAASRRERAARAAELRISRQVNSASTSTGQSGGGSEQPEGSTSTSATGTLRKRKLSIGEGVKITQVMLLDNSDMVDHNVSVIDGDKPSEASSCGGARKRGRKNEAEETEVTPISPISKFTNQLCAESIRIVAHPPFASRKHPPLFKFFPNTTTSNVQLSEPRFLQTNRLYPEHGSIK